MLRHLELYSGIGGMRLGVKAVLPANIQYAGCPIDINRVANHVYERNFGEKPQTKSIEHCSWRDLDIAWHQQQSQREQQSLLLWSLSPPCQPYTTTSNSKQQDAEDGRASSFSHLLQLLPQLSTPPTHILLENVPAFYGSRSYQHWRSVLLEMGYQMFDVALCPSQLGLPHRRPRHYTLARLVRGRPDSQFSTAAVAQLEQLSHHMSIDSGFSEQLLPGHADQQLKPYLQLDWSHYTQPLRQCAPDIQQQVQRYALPLDRVARYFRVLDIVTPQSVYSNCFTKGYQKNILGCGSYIMEAAVAEKLCKEDSRGRWHLTQDPYKQAVCTSTNSKRSSNDNCCDGGLTTQQISVAPTPTVTAIAVCADLSSVEQQLPPAMRVRAFTPREVANLQGFPQSFNLLADVSDRQAYALLGNSVSVDAVAYLAKILLEDVTCGV